jgi:hypothetical protein
MMKALKKILSFGTLGVFLLIAAFDVWGFFGLGKLEPQENPVLNENANRVVLVSGATGSVGDGLLKAAIEDPLVEKVHVITRRSSERIEEGVESGKVEMHILQDFTDYSSLSGVLPEVNTVMWGLGTSSFNVDDATFTWIHVDFPVAFVTAWLAARNNGPMSFHYVTGMGTDPEGRQQWAREKGRAEQELATLAQASDLRTFSYRSAFIRPTSEQSNVFHYLLEVLLRPGSLVITGKELGQAMLEISARTEELANGTLIDNADSIAYAKAYEKRDSE